ncbi:MAG: MFS transporter [Proteobacteria bacterium]|nr:MFS transporter [Pseudomonadota bacterium]
MSEKIKNPRLTLAVAAFAAFLATFNETYLNVGFEPIMRSFDITVSTVQWLATAYMLGAAVMVPVTAFLYRSFNTKKLFLVTVALLMIGSLIGANASSIAVLLTGRIIQSIGTGMLIPTGMNITLEVAPREKLGTYMGIMGAMTTLGPSLSVIAAGVLLSFFEWNMLLWVFGGLCAILFILGFVGLGNIAHLTHPRLDPASVALIGTGLVGLLYGISTVFTGDRIIACISACVGVALLALFVWRQKRIESPLINLSPLFIRAFAVSVVLNMLALVVIFAMNIVVPIYLQSAREASSMNASMILFPAILLSCVVAPVMGRVYDKKGIRIILPVGFLMIAFGAGLLGAGHAWMSFLAMAMIYIPVICGSAFVIGPVQSFALSKLSREQNPHGVTIMSTGFQIAGCLGASLFTGVYGMVMHAHASSGALSAASSEAFRVASFLAAALALIGVALAVYLGKSEARSRISEAAAPDSISLRDIMKTDVYAVRDTDSLISAMQFMVEKKISGLPVLDSEGKVVGFLSDTDIMRCLAKVAPVFGHSYVMPVVPETEALAQKMSDLVTMKVLDVARVSFVKVDVGDDVGTVCTKLLEAHAKKAPVLENGQIVGIINRSNITKYVMKYCLQHQAAADGTAGSDMH